MNDNPPTPDHFAGAPAHPDVDAWIAYHEGELAAADEERLRGHLVKCPACVSTLLELDAFDAGGDPDALSEFERAAAWRAMRAALEREERPTRAAGGPRWGGRFALPSAVAASLVACTLGLALWNTHQAADELRATVAMLSAPQVNAPIRDLYPDTATRSGGAARTAEVPAAEFFTLVLNLEEHREFSDYEVEIRDAANDVAWARDGFEMSPFGTFTLGLSRRFLATGVEHRVLLYGVGADGSRELLQDYALRLR